MREALEHLWEPEYLRQSPLLDLGLVRGRAEQEAFPATPSDLVGALQDILREAVEALKPEEPERRGARRWRAYHLLHYAYWEELPGEVAASRLHISRRTMYRDLSKAIRQLADVLRDRETRLVYQALPLAHWVEAVPAIKNFVGRAEELADYQRLWQVHPVVVLEGIAGIGKTSLGAELVRRYAAERPAFWYSFRRGLNDDIHSVLLALAAFLARQGRGEFWRFLQHSDEATTPQPLSLKISYLVNSLQAERYVLCFDDFHLVNEDARLRSLFDELQDEAHSDGLSLFIISRHTPAFVKELICPPLRGMSRADARQLLERAGLSDLPQGLFDELYEKTGGNPQLLKLFMAWTTGREGATDAFWRFVAAMPVRREVQHYLLHNVYNSLEAQEREVVKALALLRPPTEDAAVEAVLEEREAPDVGAVLRSLARKHVVEERAGTEGVVFFHAVLREFCDARIATDVRRAWHRRAGAYYEGVQNPVEAAYHYLNAGSHAQCAEILVAKAEHLINRGQCRPMLDLLDQVDQSRLTPEQWLKVCLVGGEVLIHTAAYEEAIARYQAALHYPQLSKEQRARICHRLSWSHEILGDLDLALTYAQEGLELFEGELTRSPMVGPLLQALAWAYFRRGENRRAYEIMSQAVEVLGGHGEYLKELGQCYRGKGGIATQLGDLRQAKADTRRGLEISERIGDTSGVAMALNNMGIIAKREGKLEQALTCHKQSLFLREQIGDMYGLFMSYHNLGEVYFLSGNLVQGQKYLENALTLASSFGMRRAISATLGVLAEVLTAEGDYLGVIELYRRALEIAQADGYWDYVADFNRVRLKSVGTCRQQ